DLRARTHEALILSTCNRVELYGLAGHSDSGADALLRVLAERRGLSMDALRPHAYAFSHEQAVRHLLRVASGLDSMVLGEDQILAQVRSALEDARGRGALGHVLGRLGAAALACGKRVRSATGIARHATSVVSLGVRAALGRRSSLEGDHVVVL